MSHPTRSNIWPEVPMHFMTEFYLCLSVISAPAMSDFSLKWSAMSQSDSLSFLHTVKIRQILEKRQGLRITSHHRQKYLHVAPDFTLVWVHWIWRTWWQSDHKMGNLCFSFPCLLAQALQQQKGPLITTTRKQVSTFTPKRTSAKKIKARFSSLLLHVIYYFSYLILLQLFSLWYRYISAM